MSIRNFQQLSSVALPIDRHESHTPHTTADVSLQQSTSQRKAAELESSQWMRLAFNLQYLFTVALGTAHTLCYEWRAAAKASANEPNISHDTRISQKDHHIASTTLLRLLLPLNEQVCLSSHYTSGEPQMQRSLKLTNPFNR